MSSESSNSDCNDWTWVTSDGLFQDEVEIIGQNEINNEENESNAQINFDDSLDSVESGNDSCSSSDIEKIEDLPLVEEKPKSHSTPLNLTIDPADGDDVIGDEISESVDDDSGVLLTPVENKNELIVESTRTYIHTPNERVNVSFNILMVLALATVLGLGLGHFIGWSSQWFQYRDNHQSQVDKLKILQEELTSCLSDKTSSSLACDRKLNYWKRQFEELLFENEDLQRMVDYGPSNCGHKNLEVEKEKLKLSLFYKQLEHAETLKQFELIQQDERTHRQKLNTLEQENENLKMQVELESKDDEKFLNFLIKENVKLRLSMQSIDENSNEYLDEDDSLIRVEMGSLREQINQLHSENEDLRQVIAKLRYGRPFESPASTEKQNEMNELQTENGELKIEIGKIRYSRDGEKINDLREKIEEMRSAIDEERNQTKMWKKMYEESKAEYNVTKAAWQLLDAMQTTTDEMLHAIENNSARIVNVVKEAVNKSNDERWSDKMWSGINDSTRFLSSGILQQWAEMQKFVSQHEHTGRNIVHTVNTMLAQTADTVTKAVRAVNVTKTQEHAEKIVTNIMDKFWDVVDDLNRRWDKESQDSPKKMLKKNKNSDDNKPHSKTRKEKNNSKPDWVFDRARYREKQRRNELNRRPNKRNEEEENWYLRKKRSFDNDDKKFGRNKFRNECNKSNKNDCDIKSDWSTVETYDERCCRDGRDLRMGDARRHCGC